MIKGVSKLIVPVDDQESAKEFWTTRLGFQVATDAPYGEDERWIEVSPPGGAPLLVSPLPGVLRLRRRTRDLLRVDRAGRPVPWPPTEMDFGWWAMFEDDAGTRYALGQWE